ncbi:phage shock protein B [Shewanella woodyi]|nr:phage shock protein B [Shewanella woodyi]
MMDKEIIIMVIMLALIISTAISEGLKHYFRMKKITKADIKLDELELLRKQNRHLEDRVQTLEKIVTDSSYDLKQQINAL